MRYLILIIMLGFFSAGGALAATPLPVFVSILPQKYFVEQIGKERVDVRVMVQPGASPATYEPKPGQMAALSRSAMYFSIGVPFEHAWLEKIRATNPQMTLVHTDRGINKRAMAAHHHEVGEHPQDEGPHHDHAEHSEQDSDHRGLDPHIWLAPQLVKRQVETILVALQKAAPADAEFFAANYRAFRRAIDDLDRDLKMQLSGGSQRAFMVFHPSWGYFAEAYGLHQVPIEVEGKSPKPAQLSALIEEARQKNIRVIFVQPQFSTRSAELIAREIGGEVVYADPLAADWPGNLRAVAAKFARTLK